MVLRQRRGRGRGPLSVRHGGRPSGDGGERLQRLARAWHDEDRPPERRAGERRRRLGLLLRLPCVLRIRQEGRQGDVRHGRAPCELEPGPLRRERPHDQGRGHVRRPEGGRQDAGRHARQAHGGERRRQRSAGHFRIRRRPHARFRRKGAGGEVLKGALSLRGRELQDRRDR